MMTTPTPQLSTSDSDDTEHDYPACPRCLGGAWIRMSADETVWCPQCDGHGYVRVAVTSVRETAEASR